MNDSGHRPSAGQVRRTIAIVNQRGLHARAAAKFVKCAERFNAEILVARHGIEVSGRSIMGLMMLAASPGTEVEVTASGPEAKAAIDALGELIGNKFDED
ncbi:MAG: HPr family phosphocarrier protein [Alphaproteobacteria bacterium]|jgi:phosphocarrier protein|nr:HPr family phosphocarrier protein [Alphaproteobacteria bacterium]MDP6568120.1 HPr family phosphocarrier protein [Alphaproteobacteria bacterium]MDP6813797.1 HPr family phosphocarrier protein [Alphaproteobacteria bacterium]